MNDAELNRLYWHSRRGMLELDLILIPFVTQRLPKLDGRYITLYRDLLAQEDQDLFAWLVLGSPPPDETLQEMVKLIIA